MATPVSVSVVDEEGDVSLISWGAVIAGGLAAAAVTLVLLAFGAGLGFAVVSPWANEGVSATTFKIGAGVYLIVVAMLASTVGGFIAGRFRARWVRAHRDEVFFRDTAHGFLAWALATVISAAALGAATSHILQVHRPVLFLRPEQQPPPWPATRPMCTSMPCCAAILRAARKRT